MGKYKLFGKKKLASQLEKTLELSVLQIRVYTKDSIFLFYNRLIIKSDKIRSTVHDLFTYLFHGTFYDESYKFENGE